VGWYADLTGLRADPSLRRILALSPSSASSPAALASSPDYYAALLAECPYDRSLLIRFLLPVQTRAALASIAQDSQLSPANMVSAAQVRSTLEPSPFLPPYYLLSLSSPPSPTGDLVAGAPEDQDH
jgi:hypothetical protein